jgi:putative phage-type endonuclease
VKRGELITPTGRLIVSAEEMRQDRPGWLAARRKTGKGAYRIGASEVPSILDLDGVDTPAHVYRRKVHGIETPVNEAMIFGTLLEPVIAQEWAVRNRVDRIDEIGLVARDGDPWAVATIDRRVFRCPIHKDTADGECLCEVKNMSHGTASKWHRDIPDRILAQMIFQLWVTGYPHGHLAALDGGNKLKQMTIYADRERELTEYVVTEVRRFLTENLEAGVEPRWNNEKPDKMIQLDNATHPERDGVAELDIDGIADVMDYAQFSADAGAAEKLRKQGAARLRQLADGAEVAKFAGERAFWYGEGSKPKVDLDMLKERWPDAYDAVVSETTFPVLNIDAAYKVRKKSK